MAHHAQAVIDSPISETKVTRTTRLSDIKPPVRWAKAQPIQKNEIDDDKIALKAGDYPTTPALRNRLVEAGIIEAQAAKEATPDAVATNDCVPIGTAPNGAPVFLDLAKLLSGRMLVQGSSGAGKSKTLRRVVEEAHDYLTVFLVDPEGEFGNLAAHIGATSIKASDIANDGLTAAALRARHHRLPLHIDLSDLAPDIRIEKASAFLSGIIAAPKEDWGNTVMVVVDEAHLLAPHMAASAKDAEMKRLGIATLTELVSRGRKRGICCVLATQRLAKLATSVESEMHNVLIGLNVFDRDIARASALLGFSASNGEALRHLQPGQFYAFGPALSKEPVLALIAPTVTEHLGATPQLMPSAYASMDEARATLQIDQLPTSNAGGGRPAIGPAGQGRGADAFLLHPSAVLGTQIARALRVISPNATTASDLAKHIPAAAEEVDLALDLLSQMGIVDTVPRSENRIVRLSARLRRLVTDVPVVGLS